MPCVNHPDAIADLSTCARCGRAFCGDCVISLQGQTVCAGCKVERVQDIKSGSLDEHLELAGRWPRLGSAIVDGLILGVPLTLFVTLPILGTAAFTNPVAARQGLSSAALAAVILIPPVVNTVYEGLMLAARGQTLGKMLLGIKVVRPDGGDISPGQGWGRAAARFAIAGLGALSASAGILYLIDCLMIFSKQRTTLHDRIAKTRVIRWKT